MKIIEEIMNNYPEILFNESSLQSENHGKFAYDHVILGLNTYKQETIFYFDENFKMIHSELTDRELFNSSLYSTFCN